MAKQAPNAVANFVHLTTQGFYTGQIFNQVVHGAYVRTGDPNGVVGQEPDGAGYSFPIDRAALTSKLTYGTVAMVVPPNGRPSGQFFIATHDYRGAIAGTPNSRRYGTGHVEFARVTRDSIGVIERIARQPVTHPAEAVTFLPTRPIYIESISVVPTSE